MQHLSACARRYLVACGLSDPDTLHRAERSASRHRLRRTLRSHWQPAAQFARAPLSQSRALVVCAAAPRAAMCGHGRA
eukprot:4913971-Pleurochrysis_carterae.AAC.1